MARGPITTAAIIIIGNIDHSKTKISILKKLKNNIFIIEKTNILQSLCLLHPHYSLYMVSMRKHINRRNISHTVFTIRSYES